MNNQQDPAAVDTATPPEYEIETLTDFLKVPADRIGACLEDLAAWIESARSLTELCNSVSELAKYPRGARAVECQKLIWIDDRLKDVTIELVGYDHTAPVPSLGPALLFAGADYYPVGGVGDFRATGTEDQMKRLYTENCNEWGDGAQCPAWGHIADAATMQIIWKADHGTNGFSWEHVHPRPHCPASYSTLDWKAGPSGGGEGTAGGDRWWDGDALLVIVELGSGGREVFVADISADEGRADMVLSASGDDTGWQLSDIYTYAKLDSSNLPPQPLPAGIEHGD